MTYVTRFAPSPTGPLHLGHAFSALTAFDRAQARSGKFHLRIEDIDRQRAKPEWEQQIYDDLTWLGITWETPVMRQSDRLDVYRSVVDDLWRQGALYLCTCTRRDIDAALSAPQEGVDAVFGPDGPIYPGTCRNKPNTPDDPRPNGALRLRMPNVASEFVENGQGPSGEHGRVMFSDPQTEIGDMVVSRRDFIGSYHLSVVLDDAAQGITEVVRGQDLFEATKIHVILQNLLNLPKPEYFHHRLIRDASGKRLAKRDDARAIGKYREDGASPADIRRMVGLN